MSLQKKLLLSTVPIFAVTTLFLSIFTYWYSEQNYTRLGENDLSHIANMTLLLCIEYEHLVQEGKLTREEARQKISDAVLGPTLPDGTHHLAESEIAFAEEGYIFIVNSAGIIQAHPILPYGNDQSEQPVVQQIINTRNGIYRYDWQNRGETTPREKLSSVRYFEPWDWYINVATYKEEFIRPAKDQLILTVVVTAFATLLFVALLFFNIGRIVDPLKRLTDLVDRFSIEKPMQMKAVGKLSQGSSELVRLIDAYNRMISGLQERIFIKETFGRYVSRQVQEAILKDSIPLQGEKKSVAILFSDLRDFTALSESIRPEATVQFLNEYFTLMVDVIVGEEGTIDMFIGDAIMSVFGAPIGHADDADRCLRSARTMFLALSRFNRERAATGEKIVHMGIGMHYGEVIAGNIGSAKRMEYTVIGDTVNVTSRLESLTSFYGTPALASESFLDAIDQKERLNVFREVDRVRVKGRKRPFTIYEYFGWMDDARVQSIQTNGQVYLEAMQAYRARRWERGLELFRRCRELFPRDRVSELYIERCAEFQKNPPPDDWDGVFQHHKK
ncbi:MAG: cache domain-containing protein [Spirochaetales bacterium]|nr:cache domain-containing protein [Leptospiraceae bacterium]MCP5480685.1 cache domain-containing protein [Spirochaetales bacterium]MCP5484037.1 cache domain-containing protein [Spirochaetales bacterium]